MTSIYKKTSERAKKILDEEKLPLHEALLLSVQLMRMSYLFFLPKEKITHALDNRIQKEINGCLARLNTIIEEIEDHE